MKTINKISAIILFVSLCATLNAQTKDIRQGNRNFRKGNYSEAEKDYKNSLDKKYNDKAQFNLGDVYYQQKKKPQEVSKAWPTETCRKTSKPTHTITSETA